MIPELGEIITFVPSAYNTQEGGNLKEREIIRKQNIRSAVKGRVIGIHYRHRYYRVAYETDYNGIQHECFKF